MAARQRRPVELARQIADSAGKDLDDNDARQLLATIVRRWSATVPATYRSHAASLPGARHHREHVVPVRVLVDRMIARPRTVERLLRQCIVIADVTPAEHKRIGTLTVDHPDLHMELRSCRIGDLVDRSWGRYGGRVKVYDISGQSSKA